AGSAGPAARPQTTHRATRGRRRPAPTRSRGPGRIVAQPWWSRPGPGGTGPGPVGRTHRAAGRTRRWWAWLDQVWRTDPVRRPDQVWRFDPDLLDLLGSGRRPDPFRDAGVLGHRPRRSTRRLREQPIAQGSPVPPGGPSGRPTQRPLMLRPGWDEGPW